MQPIYRFSISLLFMACFAVAAFAQDRKPDQTTSKPEASVPVSGAALTGKERMGRKWMDEQRIDNCNVPIDKRGRKPRSSACPHIPSG
jgi:hypothetical protein